MKKHITKLTVILVTLALLAGVVFAVTTATTAEDERLVPFFSLNPTIAENLQSQGWSNYDINRLGEIMEITHRNGNDVNPYFDIVPAFDRLRDWRAVRREFGITDQMYAEYLAREQELRDYFYIPRHIENEMIAAGYSEFERRTFVSASKILRIDIETYWNMMKSGMTTDEVFEAQMAIFHRQSELLSDFILGDMSVETFVSRLERGTEAEINELVNRALTDRQETRERFIELSGITEEEMEFLRQLGMTNPFEMAQAKIVSNNHGIDLATVARARLMRRTDWHFTDWQYLGPLILSMDNDLLNNIDNSINTPEQDEPIMSTSDEISVTLNGTRLQFDVAPVVYGNRTMVPMRTIFEALGMNVEWNDDTRAAVGIRNNLIIVIPIDSTTALVNGEAVELDVPAILHNGRTMVPVRFIAEASGANVDWDSATQTVVITAN